MCAEKLTSGKPKAALRPEYEVLNLDRGSRLGRHVHVAGSSSARKRGLLGIDSLEAGTGIWITPCEAIHTFGMQMAIDAIFLDSKFCVKKLKPYLPPGRISVCISASSVLELAVGTISGSATQLGDRLAFRSGFSPEESE